MSKKRAVARTQSSPKTRETLAHSALQNTLLGELIDNAQIGVLVVDQGRYIAANHHACTMLGYGRTEVIGKRVGELNPTSELPVQFQEIAEGRRQAGELVVRRKDGEELHLCYRAVRTTLAGMDLLLGLFWPAG